MTGKSGRIVLREGAQDDANRGKRDQRDSEHGFLLGIGTVFFFQNKVKNQIESRHRNRSNQLTRSQPEGIGFQPRRQQCDDARNQMECVSACQHDCHNAEHSEKARPAFSDQQDADCHCRNQICGVKQQFHDTLNHNRSPCNVISRL